MAEASTSRAAVLKGGPLLPAPQISLVVSSIGRPTELRRLIESLRRELEDGPTVELIVVDQSDDGRCLEVLRALKAKPGPVVSWFYLRSPLGVSRGRNAGMAIARGELIMFPDDDAWFNGDTLTRAAAHLDDNPDHDGLCTQLQDGHGAPSMLRWADTARTVTKHNHHRTSIGSTMLFRIEAARAAGGFDETVGPGAVGWYGSCEDADFLLRVIERGGHVWYDPDVVMNHRDSRRDGGPLAQAKSLGYGCGQGHMWRQHRFPLWLIVGLALRRLIGGMLWSLWDRPDIGRAHRAWVRGSINGWIGRPPVDLATDIAAGSVGSDPPTSAEFRRSLSWRFLVAPIGTVATFALTAIAARTLAPSEVTIFYALLAALMIGPILGRFGLNQWAVKDLASLRTSDDIATAVTLGRRYVISVLGPAAVAAPLISVLFMAGISLGLPDLGLVVLATIILFAETWRLAISDVLIGLGQTGWAAALAHQVRAVAVTLAVIAYAVITPGRLDLEQMMALMALIAVILVVAGLYRLWTLPGRPHGSGLTLQLPDLLRRGLPFLFVDLILVVVARGDVWLAGSTLADETAARYGTASVLAAQIGVPIGLASVALAPVVAGLVAQRKLDAVERVVRTLATVVAYVLVPVFVAFVFFGRSLLELAYGSPYGDALPYLLVLMIGNLALALLGAGPVVLLMSGRQRETMVVGACWFAAAAPTAVVAALAGGAMALALASAMTTVGLYVLLAFTTWALTGVRLLPYLRLRELDLPRWAPLTRLHDAMLFVGSGAGRRRTAARSQRRSVWWLWPAAPLMILVGPTLVAAALISDSVYERAWRTPKGLDGRLTTLLLGVVVAIVAGALVMALAERDRSARPAGSWPTVSEETTAVLQRIYPVLIGLTLFGYGVWLAMGLARGLTFGDVRSVLETQDNYNLPIKEKLSTLPGITTLTQAAIPAAVVGVLLDAHRPSAAVRWGYRLIIAMAVARGFMLAERLAIAEIVVPVIVVRTALIHRRTGPRGRFLIAMAPVVGLVLLLVGFSVSEYSRSWNWYSDQGDGDFVDFASERLLGYYATSHNNGALLLDHGEVVGDVPFHTTAFVWQIPPGSQLSAGLTDDVDDDRRRVLRGFGNPEFNSPGGLASILIDYGLVGGTAFAFGLGLVLGALHLGFIYGRLPGLLLYPVAFTGLLELPRYLYWFQGRATPAVMASVGLGIVVSMRHRRDRQRRFLKASIPTAGLTR